MPPVDAVAAAEDYRARLLAMEREAALRLVKAYKVVADRLQASVDALTAEIDAMVVAGEEPKVWKVKQLESYKRLQRQIADEVSKYAAVVENEIDQVSQQAIRQGLDGARSLTQASLPGMAAIDAAIMEGWQNLPAESVKAMLGFLSPDSPLRRKLQEKLGPAVADLVGEKLLEGIALGYNPRKVARIIRDATGQGLTWSLTTSRTSMLYAHREATRAAYKANEDIVPGWTWRATKDSRTCMGCMAMDGTEHTNDEVLNDHHCGRCYAEPKTVTYRELGLDVDEPSDPDKWLSSLPEDQRRQMLGKRYDAWVRGDVRFSESTRAWFERQPEAVQRSMMGKGAYQNWKDGKFDLGDMSGTYQDDVYGEMRRAKTLKELVGE